jgi:ABC-type lipoprotein export system ATPase subunit
MLVKASFVLDLFATLNKELRQTIVMVTHEPEDEKYVNRVIILSDGFIEKREIPPDRPKALCGGLC